MTIALAIIGGAMLGATLCVALMALVVAGKAEEDRYSAGQIARALRDTTATLSHHVRQDHPTLIHARRVLTAYDTEQGR